MQPIEGTRYADPVAGEFVVIAVGMHHGWRCVAAAIGDELVVFKLQAWPVLFPDPKPLGSAESNHACVYHGRLCQVGKTTRGDLNIHEIRRLH